MRLIAFLFSIFLIFSIIYYLSWRFYNYYEIPIVKMKFKQWESLYYINPDFYCFKSHKIENICRIYYYSSLKSNWMDFYYADPEARIVFSYFGYLCWKRFMFKQFLEDFCNENNNRNEKSKQVYTKILKQAQIDIDNIKKQAEKEINEAQRINQRNNKNLKGD